MATPPHTEAAIISLTSDALLIGETFFLSFLFPREEPQTLIT